MPQPVISDVHVNAALTEIAVAYIQDEANYIADKVFPVVAVQHQADKYFKFTKGDWFRDQAKKRADGVESAGAGFNLTTGSYSANVWALHKDVGEQVRRNADPAIDMDVDATKFVMQQLMISREVQFMNTYMATSVWSGQSDATGTAGGTPGGTTPAFWNDDANGDPFTDVAAAQTSILQNTGFLPNKLVITWPVYQALRKQPLVLDRVKYTMQAKAQSITPALLAAAFDVDEVLVSKAVYNTGVEGGSDSFSFIAGKNALLLYSAPAPSLMVPSAGYTFGWQGFTGLNNLGVRVQEIPTPLLGNGSVRIEGELAYDMQVVAADCGAYFSGIVQ